MSAYLLPDQMYGNDSLVVNSMPTMPQQFYDGEVTALEKYELVCSSSNDEEHHIMSHLTVEEVGYKRRDINTWQIGMSRDFAE